MAAPITEHWLPITGSPLSTFPFQLFPVRRIMAQLFVMGGANVQLPIGRQVSLPGHFDLPVTLESARPLGKGFECSVRLHDGTLDEASSEQMRLVAQALAGPALKGGELADVSPNAELSSLGKLLANWQAVVEGKAATTDRQRGQERFL